jgi:chaperonin cofactor prefoldin
MKYNPVADYKWDLVDAKEDVEWMISEIKRLREQLDMYKELTEELKRQIREEIGGSSNTGGSQDG